MTTTTVRRIAVRTTDRGTTYTTAGRDERGRFSRLPVYVAQAAKGHWYRTDDKPDDLHNDTVCRGCGHHGHFDYILDYQPCPAPASTTQVLTALRTRTAA